MKDKRVSKELYRVLSLFLCAFIIFSALALSSCGGGDDEPVEETVETEEQRKVIRVKKGVLAGKQISGDDLELVDVPISGIPEGAIDSLEAIVGKYATINIVMGEYVFDRMLSTDPLPEDESLITYIVVSDRIENATTKDITAELQKLIDEHPGRTIYFNDGVYTISSTIYIPSDKEKGVSIRLSNYATIKASKDWKGDSAMIAVGAKNDKSTAEAAENAIMGGKIDGAGFAKIGVSLENCASTLISDVTLKNFTTSLLVKESADSANVECVTVKGNGAADSVGILNSSSRGTFATVNISDVNVGVKNSGKNNDFRAISVTCNKASDSSTGFYEAGDSNVYELCTAENFTNGYFIGNSAKSVFEACNSSWTSAEVVTQNAFVAEGSFNSVITASTARFFDASSANAYIKLTSVGGGIVKAPIFDTTLCDDEAYKTVLAGSVVLIK